eukprot:CAMPEP_0198257680 /NCGR_PEP_ID=MMETSP1447-20131203/7287_1 /TAXON_ID=420782 /ORGANISM="Chaetoceros dichaeta, Strain CCMP1751" /LENGTH=632 /DNA_ID=CAMNT_0043944633 /DNA_START=66 /DNA_END=1964 /DNA_ORIENTATION=+
MNNRRPPPNLLQTLATKMTNTTTTTNKNIQNGILDLHGLTKEKAIAKMTAYLHTIRRNHTATFHDGNVCIVTIITGSGSHSIRGPVLRTSVENTLTKRQMDFKLNHGKGSFSVDALSGIDLYAESNQQKEDSKVLIVPARPTADGINLTGRRKQTAPTTTSTTTTTTTDDDPLPSEVAADDKLISNAKRISYIETARRTANGVREDEKNLTMALNDSTVWIEEEEEEERRSMERAIGESLMVVFEPCVSASSSASASSAVEEEDVENDALKEAIRESLRVSAAAAAAAAAEETNRSSDTVNHDFELAIRESLEFTEARSLEEEEAMMKQALEESVIGSSNNDAVVVYGAPLDVDTDQGGDERRLGENERSEGTEEEEEEEAMRRAMEESLLENDSAVSPIDDDDDDDLKRAIGESLKEDGISLGSIVVVDEEEEALKRAIEESKANVANLQAEDDVMKQAIENSLIENTRNRAFYEEEKVMDLLAMKESLMMGNVVCTLADDSIKHSIENSLVDDSMGGSGKEQESLWGSIMTQPNDSIKQNLEDNLCAGGSSSEMRQMMRCTLSLTLAGERSRGASEEEIMEQEITESSLVSNSIAHLAVAKEQPFEDHPTTVLGETGRAAPQCNLSLNFG